jgi:hypothetical protein
MADKETDVRVKLGTDHGDVDTGLRETVASLNAAVSTMTAALGRVNAASAQNREHIEQNNQAVASSFLQLRTHLESFHGMVISSFTRIQTGMAAVTAALAGGAAYKKFIDETMEFNSAVMKLAKTMGINSEQATTLKVALNSIGMDSDAYTQSFIKFERQMRRNSDGLKALGVDTDAIKKGTISSMEGFNQAVQIIGKYKQGHDQLQVAMEILGTRGMGDIQKLLRLTSERMEEARKKQEELGLTVTKENMAMQLSYKESMADVHEVFTAIGKVIADIMMPRLTDLAKWFSGVGPTAVQVMRDVLSTFVVALDAVGSIAKSIWAVIKQAFSSIGQIIQSVFGGEGLTAMQFFRNALAVVEIAILFFKAGFLEWAEIIRAGLEILGMQWSRFATTAKLALQGDFRGAIAAWNSFAGKTEEIVRRSAANMKKINQDMLDDMAKSANKALTGVAPEKGTVIEPKGGKTAPDNLGKHKQEHDTRMQEWRDELVQMQQTLGYFNEMTKQQEAEYWEQKLALVRTNSKEDLALRRQLNRLIYEDKKAFAHEEQALEVQSLQTQISEARFNMAEKMRLAVTLAQFQKATWGENSKQYRAALAEETKLKREQVQELLKLEKMYEESRKNMRLSDLALEEANFQLEVDLGRVSNEQKFAQLVTFENRKFEIERQALQREADALVVNENATYEMKLAALQRIEALERDHQAKILKIKLDAIREGARTEQEAIAATGSAFEQMIGGLVSNAKDWKHVILDAAKSLEQQLTQLAAKKLWEQIAGPGTEGNNFLSKMFGGMFNTQKNTTGSAGAVAADATLKQLAGTVTQNTTAMANLMTEATSTVAQFTALDTVSTTVTTSFSSLVAAANQAAAALLQVGANGGGGGGLGGLFGKGGGGELGAPGGPIFGSDGGGIPSFAVGSSYIPRNMLAVVHEGEAIVPKKYNTGAARMAPNVSQTNYYAITGAVDTRTQAQIAGHNARALRRATYR